MSKAQTRLHLSFLQEISKLWKEKVKWPSDIDPIGTNFNIGGKKKKSPFLNSNLIPATHSYVRELPGEVLHCRLGRVMSSICYNKSAVQKKA